MNWFSLLGMVVLIFTGFLLSEKKSKINLRLVAGVFFLELFLGFLFLKLQWGVRIFEKLNAFVLWLTGISRTGTEFLFGVLAIPPGQEGSLGFILFFQALPVIVFFSSLISVLYYYRIMKYVIEFFSFVFNRLFRISGAESLVAASNIFVGIESTITVRPYLKTMTRSELHAVLTAGLSTVASNVMAVYVFTLGEVFPKIAGHLITASLLSAPASLLFAKLLVPETEKPETLGKFVRLEYERESSVVEAIIHGATTGLKLISGIVALLLAVIGIVSLLDAVLQALFEAAGAGSLSLKTLFGYAFYPLVWLTGVPQEDVMKVAMLAGERLVLTEVYAYRHLAELLKSQEIQPVSAIIASYILCGFTHFASLAIFVGGLQSLIPEKTKVLASLSFRALLAANLAGIYTGAVAGFFSADASLLFR